MQRFNILTLSIAAGAAEVRRYSELLDRINVFPVMDGDTGSNMSVTLEGLVSSLKQNNNDLCSSIPELFRSACGNSGIILAQFLSGFLKQLSKSPNYSVKEFAESCEEGRKKAYSSIMHPKEGTLLTAMTCVASFLSKEIESFGIDDYNELCNQMICTVLQTQQMIPKLRSAAVVDSGALGFCLFASGLMLAACAIEDQEGSIAKIDALNNGYGGLDLSRIKDRISSEYISTAKADNSVEKYCINLLIESNIDKSVLSLFGSLGDSLDVATEEGLVKLHIHGNDPDAIIEKAKQLGNVLDSKIQNMHEALVRYSQNESDDDRPLFRRFRIVTDSSVSLDRKLAAELGILIIDNNVIVNEKRLRDRDVNFEELLSEMKAGQVFKTAQVTPEDAAVFLKKALKCSEHVWYIGVGKAYTNTQESISIAASSINSNSISIMDSCAASGQLGVICLAVQRFAETAESAEDVTRYAAEQIKIAKEYLVIDNLKYLVRSGRIGKIKAAFATALSIKPIVGHGSCGAVTIAKAYSSDSAVNEILKMISVHSLDSHLLSIVEYTDNLEYANSLVTRLQAVHGNLEVLLAPLSSASAVHMGPGTFGISITLI